MTGSDADFLSSVAQATDAEIDALHAESSIAGSRPRGHREVMRRVKVLCGAASLPESRYFASESAANLARTYVHDLTSLQSPMGLFTGDSNILSPPDSAFTASDIADTIHFARTSPVASLLATVADELLTLAERVTPALLQGGVHTPNHRWELAGALARMSRVFPTMDIVPRVCEWLEEGIDLQLDGMYSERSANYAAYVTNPSLLALADILVRPDLVDVVAKNLTAYLALLDDTGCVETMHSRRQDQLQVHFSAAPFLAQFRRCAVEFGRGDFAWAARTLQGTMNSIPHGLVAELLLDPRISSELPPDAPPAVERRHEFNTSGLVIDVNPSRAITVNAATDFSRAKTIRSGLATNPTFLRMRTGRVDLTSVRLSRRFFGYGPFRCDAWRVADGQWFLSERKEGHYYQPLAAGDRDEQGDYAMHDEGRFFSHMAFPARRRSTVELRTDMRVDPTTTGLMLEVSMTGADVAWSLELAFSDGTLIEALDDYTAIAHRDGDRLSVSVDGDYSPTAPGFYHPGDAYLDLGGTNAIGGPKHYISGWGQGTFRVTLQAAQQTPQAP